MWCICVSVLDLIHSFFAWFCLHLIHLLYIYFGRSPLAPFTIFCKLFRPIVYDNKWQRRKKETPKISLRQKSVKNWTDKTCKSEHSRIVHIFSPTFFPICKWKLVFCTRLPFFAVDFIYYSKRFHTIWAALYSSEYTGSLSIFLNAEWWHSIFIFPSRLSHCQYFSGCGVVVFVAAADIMSTIETTWFDSLLSVIQFLIFDLKPIFTISGNHLST